MNRVKLVVAAVAATIISIGVSVVFTTARADAHGTMESPRSRIFQCRFVEDVEHPTSAACAAAGALSGSAMYDWNEVSLIDVGGKHRERIPDGRLCSAGLQKYRGLDLARADWPATQMTSGGTFDFAFRASAPHKGSVSLYMTTDSYNPERPLRWNDLDSDPFLVIEQNGSGGTYTATAKVPAGKHGRHMIYAIWQRSDSPEAFYSCSDVVFDGASGDNHTPTGPTMTSTHATTAPTPSVTPYLLDPGTLPAEPSPHPAHGQPQPDVEPQPQSSNAAQWAPGVSYVAGTEVLHNGITYKCVQAHTSQVGWEPGATPALWLVVAQPVKDGAVAPWQAWVSYPVGAGVSFGGKTYTCRQAHTSLPGWEPDLTPALWAVATT